MEWPSEEVIFELRKYVTIRNGVLVGEIPGWKWERSVTRQIRLCLGSLEEAGAAPLGPRTTGAVRGLFGFCFLN